MSKVKPLLLGVNVDHVATLRQARGTVYPDPVYAALAAEQAGADGITLHLREDRRHIQDRDLFLLNELSQTRINFEMAHTPEMLDIAERLKPAHCCLVPEKREELTTEGGLDVIKHFSAIEAACARLAAQAIEVSLFVAADIAHIDAAKACGASTVEIHTGHWAEAATRAERDRYYADIVRAVEHADRIGLVVNAGHGLNYQNVGAIAALPQLNELNIGHAIVAHALFVGFIPAVEQMKKLMLQARYGSYQP
ncbi:MAG TPA: pyridoxine 5'-phosphate synthase [Pseudomonadales bacterium]|nr:pyridoxine 5'-phosphate synthase [Pseudomonadales bacterium]